LETNEGLKETRKPGQTKLSSSGREGYSQRTEVIKRRPEYDEEAPRKKYNS